MFEKNDELEIVKRSTGTIDESRIEIIESGWTSRVYSIDGGKIVFKFPRNAKFCEECKREVATLKLLKEQEFCLDVPVLNWTAEDNSYFGFYGIPGVPLREVIDGLSEDQKIDIGTQIGVFLRQLHGVKISGYVKTRTLEEQTLEYQAWYREGRELLTEFLNETALKKDRRFFCI